MRRNFFAHTKIEEFFGIRQNSTDFFWRFLRPEIRGKCPERRHRGRKRRHADAPSGGGSETHGANRSGNLRTIPKKIAIFRRRTPRGTGSFRRKRTGNGKGTRSRPTRETHGKRYEKPMSFTKINHYEKEYADTHHDTALNVSEGVG